MIHLKTDSKGDGEPCVTGTKVLCGCRPAPHPRPFYIIGHRENDLERAKQALDRGANAIEIDVRFSRRLKKFCVNHDVDWDCEKEDDLIPMLRGLRTLAAEHNLALLILDFKDDNGNSQAAPQLLAHVRAELTAHVPVKVILSTAALEDARRLMPAIGTLQAGEALAVDQENDAVKVSEFLAKRIKAKGRAFGNGVTEPVPPGGLRDSIVKGIELRDKKWFHFVYVWTLRYEASMVDYLSLGVDGIMVDDPKELQEVIRSRCFPIRLATQRDNPF